VGKADPRLGANIFAVSSMDAMFAVAKHFLLHFGQMAGRVHILTGTNSDFSMQRA